MFADFIAIYNNVCISAINLIEMAVFVAFAVPLCASDVKTCTVPRFLNRAAFVALFTFRLIFLRETALERLCAALVAEALMLFVWLVTCGGVGKGDIYFAAVCGLFCGKNVFLAFVIAAVLAMCVSCGKKNKLPFIPFMSAGSLAVYFVFFFD